MKHLAPACFRAFACAAGDCPDSCCRAGWEIVPDEETLRLYQTLPGETGDRIRAGIVPGVVAADPGGHNPCGEVLRAMAAEVRGHYGDAEPLLRQDKHRICVLLDPDGLCCVQRNFGHEALCKVCRDYPRFRRDFGGLTEHGLSLSCPTAYALATSAPPAWEEWEDDAPPVPNELDPESYLRLRKGRQLALELLAREDMPLRPRLSLLRRLAAAMQSAPEKRIKHDYALRLRRWESLPSRCRDKHCLSGLRGKQSPGGRSKDSAANRIIRQRTNSVVRICLTANAFVPNAGQAMLVPTRSLNAAALARRFLSLEILSPAWKDALERFEAMAEAGALPTGMLNPPAPEPCARWLWYELYKYWMDALDDGKLLARVDRALLMLLLGLAMDQVLPGEGPFLRRISREIEHCEENLADLLALCNHFSVQSLVSQVLPLDIF